MFVAMKNERGYATSADVIQSAADEGKFLRRQILDRWGEIEFAVEPWLDGVLVGGHDIEHVICH